MNKKIAIIGLGWLGLPLAQQLAEKNHEVVGTTTSDEKKQRLISQGIRAYTLTLSGDTPDFSSLKVNGFDVMVIAITPGFKRGKADYALNVAHLVEHAQAQQVKQIILLSSTGVYTGLSGVITEQTTLDGSVNKVRLLEQAEQAVLGFKGHHQVLRLAGLVGPDRLPGKFLAGKENVVDPDASVNLIHQQDVINIIKQLINQPHLQGIYNCISPTVSTREVFYQQAALSLGLTPPQFKHENKSVIEKIISGEKLLSTLNYHFEQPDLLRWVERAAQS